jgi:hypothetical protein
VVAIESSATVFRRFAPAAAEVVVVASVLAAFVVYVTPTLGRPLLEKHAFRQTQTAYTARVFHEEGIDLLHPRTPVLGEPFEIPFEFPLFQAGAAIAMHLGLEDDRAMRTTALTCFLATALLLFGLVRHVAGRAAAIGTIFAFTFTPFALVWSRASMIEYLATAGGVGFAWALISWRESRGVLPAALALVAGLVGMLVKPTTAIFWVAPGLAYRPGGERAQRSRWIDPWTAAIVLLPIVAAVAWTRHADAIKAASDTTAWLTSSNLREWNFGTLDHRLDPRTWDVIGRRAITFVYALILLLPAAAIAIVRSRQRLFWLAVVSAALLPPLVFTNLYFQHDYYLAAVTPAVAAVIGLGASFLWRFLTLRGAPRVVVVAVGLLLVWSTLELGRGYWLRIHGGYDDPQVLPLAREIRTLTGPDDRVATIGLGWSPAVLYYAHRRGHMVVAENERFAYDLIHDQGYRHIVVAYPGDTDLTFLSRWRWLGALGQHTFAVADSPAELPAATFVGSSDTASVGPYLESGRPLIQDDFRLTCGKRVTVPAGGHGTWLTLKQPPAQARISVSDDLVALPARTHVFVAAELASRGSIGLLCYGVPALTVLRVAAGPPPD